MVVVVVVAACMEEFPHPTTPGGEQASPAWQCFTGRSSVAQEALLPPSTVSSNHIFENVCFYPQLQNCVDKFRTKTVHNILGYHRVNSWLFSTLVCEGDSKD